jgi:glycosyltransferase involved in cell wall biosynthesis
MKIGLVTSYMPPHLGGIEQIAESLFRGYAAHGDQVRWVSSRIPSSLPARNGERVRVPCFNLVEDLFGVPVPIWGRRGWAEVNALAAWADALHVLECLYLTSAMAVGAARRHGRPAILTQNVGFIPYRLAPLNWIERAAYATLGRSVLLRASHIVLATPTAESYVRELLGGLPLHASTFPIGIDTARFRPGAAAERATARARLGLSAAGPVVLFAGRLVEKKGVPLVLEVAVALPEVRVLVAGDGPLRGMLRAAPANVTWLQAVAADRMLDCYHAADAVLLPSSGEGLPLVVQEAMACGLPAVISSDEIYADALIMAKACVTAERAPRPMSAAVREALGPAGAALGERARAHAVAHWSVSTMVARYVELMGRLVGRPAAARGRA